MNDFKTEPYSLEAEQAVIGGMLLSPQAIDHVVERLTEKDFYRQDHRLIAEAIFKVHQRGASPDVVTVGAYLEGINKLEAAGSIIYIGALAKDTPSAANIKAYAELVREDSLRRNSIESLNDTMSKLYEKDNPVAEVLDDVQTNLMMLANQTQKTGAEHVKVGLKQALEEMDKAFNSDGALVGLPTGLDMVNNFTHGLQKQDLIIVAGRPSMGKTAFAMGVALHVAVEEKKSVLFFSMEMSASQLSKRNTANLSGVDLEKLIKGSMLDSDWPLITSAMSRMSESKLYVDETPALSLAQIRARCRKQQRQHGLDLVVIDYLQLMQVPKGQDNLASRVAEISKGLKQLAKEMNIPVIALSQLNRSLENRGDKRPIMSDLRESGAIEQDADQIFFVYRDEVYRKEMIENKGIAELIASKNRSGKTGTIYLNNDLSKMQFKNYSGDVPPLYLNMKMVNSGGLN